MALYNHRPNQRKTLGEFYQVGGLKNLKLDLKDDEHLGYAEATMYCYDNTTRKNCDIMKNMGFRVKRLDGEGNPIGEWGEDELKQEV